MHDCIDRLGDQIIATALALESARADPDPVRQAQRLEVILRALHAIAQHDVTTVASTAGSHQGCRPRLRLLAGGLAGLPVAARQHLREHATSTTAATAGALAAAGLISVLSITGHGTTRTSAPLARPQHIVTVGPPLYLRQPPAPVRRTAPPGPAALPHASQVHSAVIAWRPSRPGRAVTQAPVVADFRAASLRGGRAGAGRPAALRASKTQAPPPPLRRLAFSG